MDRSRSAVAPTNGRRSPLPFSIQKKPEGGFVVAFKTTAKDKSTVAAITRAVTEALTGIEVGGQAIIPLLLDESVEMSTADMQQIAMFVIPHVCAALGIDVPQKVGVRAGV